MSILLGSLTLAQIVKSNHKAASVFEKYHLDFCCKGKRSLQQACAEQQLALEDITNELEVAFAGNGKPELEFDKMTLTQLCDYIVNTHHVYVKNELPQIYAFLQKVASKHGERHPELYEIFETFAVVKTEMESHMQKEELILFPRIKEMEKLAGNLTSNLNIIYLQAPINVMEMEHDQAGSLLNEIRILTNDYTPPEDACTTYQLSFAALKAFELDLHQHVHLENNILFPKSIETFRKLEEKVMN